MAFFAVDEQLRDRKESGVLAEVYDDADVISRVLDGAEESFVELALSIGKLVSHPRQSVADLKQLPQALAALLLNSPEYLERFQLMTRGEQIRALAKLSTTLLSTYGAAGGTTRTMADKKGLMIETYSISLWNGAQGGNDAGLSIGCGGYWDGAGGPAPTQSRLLRSSSVPP